VVSLVASAAAWVGCRDDFDIETQAAVGSDDAGSGTLDTLGSDIDAGSGSDAGGEPGGSDAGGEPGGSDAGADAGSGMDAGIDGGSGADAGIDGGSGADAGIDGGGGIDAGAVVDAGTESDAGVIGGPGDAAGAPDGSPGSGVGALDRTSFYACAGGGCGSATGTEVWLPIVVAVGLAIRRRRGRRPAA
jgi:uncharacterized protein (TIGR03382 family)